MQSSSCALPFKQTLAGASPATDAIFEIRIPNDGHRKNDEARNPNGRRVGLFEVWTSCFDIRHSQRSQGVMSAARRSAKAEVRGANPRESTTLKSEYIALSVIRCSSGEARRHSAFGFRPSDLILPLCLSSNRASFVNSYSSVRVRPGAPIQLEIAKCGVRNDRRGEPNRARHDRPSGLWCNSSISACEADGPGANPGFLTKKANARRALNEIGLSASGFCSRSNPSPGTMISRRYSDASCSSRNENLS